MSGISVIITKINVEGLWKGVETEVRGTYTSTVDENGNYSSRYVIHDQLKDRPYVYWTGKKAITDRTTHEVVAEGFKSVKEAKRYIYENLQPYYTEAHRQASLDRRFGKEA